MNLLDSLLAEQQTLTAVEQFSQQHDHDVPTQAKYYEKLLPASAPQPGQQYAFQVDLDRCSGCKACVTACHSLNGLAEDETWREVGLVIGGSAELPVLQHVTTACHHCLEPGCLSGCPVNAYEKDPVTGIVKHLDDQCFGCQYCTMTCPYEVPQYKADLGIVRKCDMCSDRLAEGEAPACVQACPHEAISISVVDVENLKDCGFPETSPAESITRPTTEFKTSRGALATAKPADLTSLRTQHAHLPLVVMLVLTQLSVGTLVVEMVRAIALGTTSAANLWLAAGSAIVGIIASTLHLGRPLYAFRAILGFGHSWLSREIVAFGIYAPAVIACAMQSRGTEVSALLLASLLAAAISGIAGIVCSVHLYAFTKRQFWAFAPTLARFSLTAILLGTAATARAPAAWAMVAAACLAKLLLLANDLKHRGAITTPLGRTANIMLGPLRGFTRTHVGCLTSMTVLSIVWPQSLLLVAVGIVAELAERYLFFAAVSPARMPGGFAE